MPRDTVDVFFELLEEETGHDYKSDFLVRSATQRTGQAFYNSLPVEYQVRLRGSASDPFHRAGWGPVLDAIEFLTKTP